MTDSIRHQRVMDLFDAVCDVPVSDRAAFLARECAGDAALQAEVESLLAHDSQTYGPVENMEDGKAAAWLADDSNEMRPSTTPPPELPFPNASDDTV